MQGLQGPMQVLCRGHINDETKYLFQICRYNASMNCGSRIVIAMTEISP
jgi:hypothetical protein